jgi:hypothetical protein
MTAFERRRCRSRRPLGARWTVARERPFSNRPDTIGHYRKMVKYLENRSLDHQRLSAQIALRSVNRPMNDLRPKKSIEPCRLSVLGFPARARRFPFCPCCSLLDPFVKVGVWAGPRERDEASWIIPSATSQLSQTRRTSDFAPIVKEPHFCAPAPRRRPSSSATTSATTFDCALFRKTACFYPDVPVRPQLGG